jgi:hypothetical protein
MTRKTMGPRWPDPSPLLSLVTAAQTSSFASFPASLQNMYGAALRRRDDDGGEAAVGRRPCCRTAGPPAAGILHAHLRGGCAPASGGAHGEDGPASSSVPIAAGDGDLGPVEELLAAPPARRAARPSRLLAAPPARAARSPRRHPTPPPPLPPAARSSPRRRRLLERPARSPPPPRVGPAPGEAAASRVPAPARREPPRHRCLLAPARPRSGRRHRHVAARFSRGSRLAGMPGDILGRLEQASGNHLVL